MKFLPLLLLILIKEAVSKRPNVLFIIVDDLRPSLKCYNDQNAFTPNIDKLATKSFLFTNAFSQQALCGPSRSSLLTSRRPDTLNIYANNYKYWRSTKGNYTTLPQHFKQNGYHTYSIGKVFHPGRLSNYSDDFPYSWSKEPFHPKTDQYTNAKTCIGKNAVFAKNLICPVIPELQPGGTLPDLESLEEAVQFLKYRNKIKHEPYFLAVGFHKPHVPFKFPINYLDFHPLDNITIPNNRWRPPLMPEVAWNPWNDLRKRDDIKLLNISFPYGPMPDTEIRKIKQAYYASVTYIDDLIGQLLKQVENNTIIVLTSDHGWSLGEHGEFAKYSNFDVSTKVPLLINVPNLSENEIIFNEPIELVDLFPTLVDLTQVSKPLTKCGLNQYEELCTEGKSLVPLMVKNKLHMVVQPLTAFTQYPRPGVHPTLFPDSDQPKMNEINIMGFSIRTNRYRYSEWVKFSSSNLKPDWDTLFGIELYDHLIDPYENNNIADRDVLKNLTSELRKKLRLGWRYA